MRYQRPGTPTPDEAYAVTAFILLYERNRGQKAKLSEKTLPKVRIELNKLSIRMFAGRCNRNLVFLSATSSCPATNLHGPLLCHPKMAVAERSKPEVF